MNLVALVVVSAIGFGGINTAINPQGKGIGFAMLTTEEADGTLRSRPLATLQMDAAGKLWFFTALSSGKVGEIDRILIEGLTGTQEAQGAVSGIDYSGIAQPVSPGFTECRNA